MILLPWTTINIGCLFCVFSLLYGFSTKATLKANIISIFGLALGILTIYLGAKLSLIVR